MDQLFPPEYDILHLVLMVIFIALVVVVYILERKKSDSGSAISWALLCLVVPGVGFVVWLIWNASIRPVLKDASTHPVFADPESAQRETEESY